MNRSRALALLSFFLAVPACRILAQSPAPPAIVHSQPLHSGRINPKLFGNFIELLDDVAPAMWAEMLNDRSFEGVTKLAAWCYYDGSPDFCDRQWDPDPAWSYDTQNPFNGKRCARLNAARRLPACLTQSGLAVKTGMTYAFSGYLRADNPRLAVTVSLTTRLPDGGWLTLASARLPPLSQQWQKYPAPLTSKGQTDRVVFELRAEGQGSVWADKLSLMPADSLKGWRRDVVDAVKQVQPALVRFGGSVCDPGEYRWKNGIGDRDFRTPFPNKVWGRLDPNDVGIDEFCQFCELTGVAPLVCLSFSDGPQNAADLVEYCNGDARTPWGAKRAANGHPAPYGVKYWQIGNEISGDDENYLNRFGAFVEEIKRADPAAAILSSFPSQKLLDRVGPLLDFIAPHHYTPDLAQCDRDLGNLAQMIDRTPGCARIKIAVTEWNVTGGDWGLGRGKLMTLENALRNARYLHVLMRHSDKAEIACRSNMANSFCGAIIETSPAALLKRPSYYVMQLYARHARPVPLRVEQPADGPDLFACGAENGEALVIFAVNFKTEPVLWTCRFDGFGAPLRAVRAEALCDTQDARQPDVMNHWSAPDRIKTAPLPLLPAQNQVLLPALSVAAIDFAPVEIQNRP